VKRTQGGQLGDGRSVGLVAAHPSHPPISPISWFHPFLPLHFSSWASKSLLSTRDLIIPDYFTPSKILIMRVGWAGKPQGKQLCYRHAVPCATLSPCIRGNRHHRITTNLISLPLSGRSRGIYKQHGGTVVVDADAGWETTTQQC